MLFERTVANRKSRVPLYLRIPAKESIGYAPLPSEMHYKRVLVTYVNDILRK